jgi:hypothetical protein
MSVPIGEQVAAIGRGVGSSFGRPRSERVGKRQHRLRHATSGRGLVQGAVMVAVWAGVAWGIGHSAGMYNPVALTAIAIAAAGLVAYLSLALRPAPASGVVVAGALVIAVIATRAVPDWSHGDRSIVDSAALLLVLSVIVTIPLALSPRTRRFALCVPLATGLVAGIVVTHAVKTPPIDVWYVLQQSAAGLVHGTNMYTTTHWPGSPDRTGFSYMPWTAVVLVPFRELFGDVRYGLVCATALGALGVHRIARRGGAAAPMLAALVFIVPSGLLMVESAWTEPLLLAYLAWTVAATLDGRTRVAIACLALAVATKQYAWPLLPLFAVWRPFGLRRTAIAAFSGLAISLPWIVAAPTAFWHNVVSGTYGIGTVSYDLSVPELLVRHHHTLPFVATAVATFAALLIGVRYTWRTGNVALACAEVLLVFNLLNHHSFYNQYWLVVELLVLGWALSIGLAAHGETAERAGTPALGDAVG